MATISDWVAIHCTFEVIINYEGTLWYYMCSRSHHSRGRVPSSRGGGALNFFSGRGVRPGFPKCRACELTFVSEKGGLWAENFQIWGLVSGKFPNLRACELKISKFEGLWAKIWMKIEAVEAKISSKGGLVNWLFCLKWDPCERQERREKGVFRAAHPHTRFLGQCPPPPPGTLIVPFKVL